MDVTIHGLAHFTSSLDAVEIVQFLLKAAKGGFNIAVLTG
ncbi:hypothetical protein V527_18665 [Pseudomonas aeruginosa VRFPA06]|nr:hypothetical protein V527_18665 [Pseudomonas aeruginosa VRFPA06]